MTLIDVDSIYRVIPSSSVSQAATELRDESRKIYEALDEADGVWRRMDEDAYDSPFGSEVREMLDSPKQDSSEFSHVNGLSARGLQQQIMALIGQQQNYESLVERAREVNAQYADAVAARDALPPGGDPEGDGEDYRQANDAVIAAKEAGDQLLQEIDKHNKSVDSTEQSLAGAVTSGDGADVADAIGLGSGAVSWSLGDGRSGFSAVEQFHEALNTTMFESIEDLGKLAKEDPERLQQWLAKNPDFLVSVQYLDPAQGNKFWQSLFDDAGLKPGQSFEDAPEGSMLHAFVTAAPLVLGNMPGVPMNARSDLNKRGLRDILRGLEGIPEGYRTEEQQSLFDAQDIINRGKAEEGLEPDLLSLFFDDEKPRAALAYGDVTEADAVVSFSHGISNDLSSLGAWSDVASTFRTDMRQRIAIEEGIGVNETPEIATVAWFGYDSKGALEVQSVDHAAIGGERMYHFQNAIDYENADHEDYGVLHSYGTTMGGEAERRHPGTFDQIYMLGSAGVTYEAQEVFEHDPRAADVTAARNSDPWKSPWPDMVAPLGRVPGISEHPVDPADTFAKDDQLNPYGGDVTFSNGDVVHDTKHVHGHDSHAKDRFFGNTTYGFLSPESSSYQEMLADASEDFRERRPGF